METQRNKLDFTGQNIYVDFDVHLKKLECNYYDRKAHT